MGKDVSSNLILGEEFRWGLTPTIQSIPYTLVGIFWGLDEKTNVNDWD